MADDEKEGGLPPKFGQHCDVRDEVVTIGPNNFRSSPYRNGVEFEFQRHQNFCDPWNLFLFISRVRLFVLLREAASSERAELWCWVARTARERRSQKHSPPVSGARLHLLALGQHLRTGVGAKSPQTELGQLDCRSVAVVFFHLNRTCPS